MRAMKPPARRFSLPKERRPFEPRMIEHEQEYLDRAPLINQAPPPIVYDPSDGDELAEAAARAKSRR
jgi:hypothetical protein